MNDTPEVIRQQMEETKSQLSEKLESLEHQVSETVQSTGTVVTAVAATAEAVQETVEAVTGAVQDAVHSVSNAFDFPRQVERHPWIAVGGSFALGYLASELLNAPTTASASESAPSAAQTQNGNGQHAVESPPTSSSKSLPWAEMRGMLTGVLMGALSTIVTQGVPTALDYFAKSLRDDPDQAPEGEGARRRSPK